MLVLERRRSHSQLRLAVAQRLRRVTTVSHAAPEAPWAQGWAFALEAAVAGSVFPNDVKLWMAHEYLLD